MSRVLVYASSVYKRFIPSKKEKLSLPSSPRESHFGRSNFTPFPFRVVLPLFSSLLTWNYSRTVLFFFDSWFSLFGNDVCVRENFSNDHSSSLSQYLIRWRKSGSFLRVFCPFERFFFFFDPSKTLETGDSSLSPSFFLIRNTHLYVSLKYLFACCHEIHRICCENT